MSAILSNEDFYTELESSLATSTEEQRKVWATTIIEKEIPIESLSKLIQRDHKTATRFLWLLGRIGMERPKTLFNELPFLFDLCNRVSPIYKTSFANYWLMAGVPPENEGKAIDLLFEWLLSADTNVSIKSRSLHVLFKLTKKYPELKNELKICLEDQMDKHSNDFKKKAVKVMKALGK